MEEGGQGLKTGLERDMGVRVVVLTLAVQIVLQPQPCYHVRTTPLANSGARHRHRAPLCPRDFGLLYSVRCSVSFLFSAVVE